MKCAKCGETTLHTGSHGSFPSYDWLKLKFHSVKLAHSAWEILGYEYGSKSHFL